MGMSPDDPMLAGGAAAAMAGGMMGAVQEGIEDANGENEQAKLLRKQEEDAVKKCWDSYDKARAFDKQARAQYAIDRRYAAGTANLNWAVTANLIGSFIDILVSFLYARNPDVSVKKAPRVDNRGSREDDDFAKTMELVISSLWKAIPARLKPNCRAQVRSTLTNGIGWLKVILVSKGTNIPQMTTELNDSRKNLAELEACRAALQSGTYQGDKTPEDINAELTRLQALEASLMQRLEVAVRKGLAVDYVAPEDMQVALDVRDATDNTNASWNANAIYRPKDDAKAMFPRLTDEDLQSAKLYYQRRTRDLEPLSDRINLTGLAGVEMNADEAEQYVTDSTAAGSGSPDADQGIPFVKIVEKWDKTTGHVYTMIDGVKRWAKDPYQPDYPTTRFFPYFALAFYPVDGSRHPQSLPWRLMKLQDEYASVRSNLRLTRQRATPGTLFNSSALEPTEAQKIQRSVQQEFTGIKPTNPDQPLRDIFAEKPVTVGDMRLYDTSPIMQDMERISGVQEALQQSVTTPKTATEAEIQQSGFASRTTADRDTLESMLDDMAHYTAELALSALDQKDAARIAGAKAFWPHGMAIDDLLTMVNISIEAGTTGKPRQASDKEAWGVVLPVLQSMQVQIMQAQAAGNLPLADAMMELLRETMARMGDETDPTRFIPQLPQQPPALPGVPGAAPGAVGPDGMPLPAPEGAAPGALEAPIAEELVPPELTPGGMIAPEIAPPLV